MFVGINNRISQSVPHLHVHAVPRRRKDGLRGFFWPRQKYASDDEAAEYRGEDRRRALAEPQQMVVALALAEDDVAVVQQVVARRLAVDVVDATVVDVGAVLR